MPQIPLPPPPAIIETQPQNRAALLGSPISLEDSYHSNSKVYITRLIFRDRQPEQNERVFEFKLAQSQNNSAPLENPEELEIVEIIADRKEYDETKQIITAIGNVEMRYAKALLKADRLEVNLPTRLAIGTGNVIIERGDQVIRGERLEYSFFLDRGIMFTAKGVIYQPSFDRDTTFTSAEKNSQILDRPLTDRLQQQQPLQRISTAQGYRFAIGTTGDLGLVRGNTGISGTSGGNINRLRFEADRVDFETDGWTAENLRITNDPFSPPELELRANSATYRTINPEVSEVVTTNSRIVFDQTISLPLFRNRLIIDRNARESGIIGFGYDSDDRGGLYVERGFNLFSNRFLSFDITPQYFIERSIFGRNGLFGNSDNNQQNQPNREQELPEEGVFNLNNFGFRTKLRGNFSPRTSLRADTQLTSLDFGGIENECQQVPQGEAREQCEIQAEIRADLRCRIDKDPCPIEDKLRANIVIDQKIGPLRKPHTLSLEYNYRDRLFNGSLGFQDVRRSFGAILASPAYPLGKSGINLNYQASIQDILADSDRPEIVNRFNRANLTRYQGAILLSRGFQLWRGEALPPTRTEGMRYTPQPIMPFLQLNTSLTGVSSLYSNGDDQSSITGNIGISGQLGHLSRNFFDYTALNVNYSQSLITNESPFFFDRLVDTQTLSLGLSQQLYGPIIIGVQTNLNVEPEIETDRSREISTDYFLEYSRRTYKIILRYTSIRQADNSTEGLGSINLLINDFNWIGNPEPFGGVVRPVTRGVKQ